MQLSAFKHTLAQVDTLEFQLPGGQFVPAHFHLTEVGHVTRNYIDCGGTVRQEKNSIYSYGWLRIPTIV